MLIECIESFENVDSKDHYIAVGSLSSIQATLEKEKKSLRKLLNNVMEEKEDAVAAVGVANAAAAEAAAALPTTRSIQQSTVSIVSLTEQSSTSRLQEGKCALMASNFVCPYVLDNRQLS